MSISYDVVNIPEGAIYVAVDDIGVCKVAIDDNDWQRYIARFAVELNSAKCSYAVMQLQEYLAGRRMQFEVVLSIGGTDFCQKVWREVSAIPYGQTKTYAEIAAAIGKPAAYRAVGLANYKNPVPIFIPCHRVIGKNGKLVGYKGDNTAFKKRLLELEYL